jgi:hypothetical protein
VDFVDGFSAGFIMSKKNNINPDHYKTAGRERQGEDILHDAYKRQYAQSRSQAGARARNFIPGAQEKENGAQAESDSATETEQRTDEVSRKGD